MSHHKKYDKDALLALFREARHAPSTEIILRHIAINLGDKLGSDISRESILTARGEKLLAIPSVAAVLDLVAETTAKYLASHPRMAKNDAEAIGELAHKYFEHREEWIPPHDSAIAVPVARQSARR